MKIVFFGGSKFSRYYLDALTNVYSEVFAFDKLPSMEQLVALSPDIGIIAYFGYIVPENMLMVPKRGFINVHYSLLPRWRGAAPVQHAILAGDKEIGISILVATKKVDSGAILAQESIPILPNDTYLSLEEKLIPLGSKMLLSVLPKYLLGTIVLKTQNEAEATYAKKMNKINGLIDWSRDAAHIERMTRAYELWPGTYTKMKNGKILKIKKVEVIDGKLKILTVQPEGKKDMPYEAFLRGHKDFVLPGLDSNQNKRLQRPLSYH